MEDAKIVDLYWKRNERAIDESSQKYGSYCHTIACNILANIEDAKECVNDTWLGAWNSIPPHRPTILSTYLGKITRRISLNKRRDSNREKRSSGEAILVIDELSDLISSEQSTEEMFEEKELTRAIDRFLTQLSDKERDAFVCRYWFFWSIPEISKRFDYTESNTKVVLFRTRNKLKAHLQKEGF